MAPRKRVEVAQASSGKKARVPAFSSRCSPAMIVDLWDKSLSVPQKKVVQVMGFGGLFELKMKQKNRIFILEVIKAFDHVKQCIRFKELSIPVTAESVGLVLGLPYSGEEVKQNASNADMVVVEEFRKKTIKELEMIIREGTTDNRFKRAFILYVLCTFLCPTMKGSTTMKLLAHVVDVDDPTKYNWGKLVVDTLVDSMKEYKAGKGEVRSIGGCVFFLTVWYLHSVFGSPSGDSDPPLVKHWTKEAAQARFNDQRRDEEGLLNPNKYNIDGAVKEFLDTHFDYEDLKEMVNGTIQMALKQQRERRAGKVNCLAQKKAHSNTHGDVEGSPFELQLMVMLEDNLLPKDIPLSPSQVLPSKEKVTLIASPLSVDRAGEASASTSQTLSTSMIEVPDGVANAVFAYCTRNRSRRKRGKKSKKPAEQKEAIVSVDGHFLHLDEVQTMAPGEWISNIVVSFHARYLNFYENQKVNPNRFYLSSWFAEAVAHNINKHKQGEAPLLDPRLWKSYFGGDLSGRNLIFAPCVYKEHWWCYVLDREAKKVYILDSLGHGDDRKRAGKQVKDEKDILDDLIVIQFKELMAMLEPTMDPAFELDLKIEPLPKQPNKDDCGIYVMKYMDMWDGVTTYEGGLTMPVWDEDQLACIRCELLVRWVMDKENKYKDNVLTAVEPQLREKGFVPAAKGSAAKPTQQEQNPYSWKRARQPSPQLTTLYTTSHAKPRTRKKMGHTD